MQVRTRHTPAFGVARLQLAPAETVLADYTALVATSYGVLVEPKLRGGSRGRRRPTTFTAPAEGGWVDLAPAVPGDVYLLELDGLGGWCVARRGVLASAATVVSDAQWAGFRALFGVDVGFLEHTSGTGSLVLSCCGAVDVVTLDSGELITVEPGHLLAYTDHTQARLRATSQALPQSVRTGDGLVLDFAGPGQLVTQTRSPRSFAEWLSTSGDGR
ncbi:TIGR00266 family protein [Actinophytocola sp.]|uniref:TIGR00266 family protein n=1 Tax=Actinophytocola sp. TaxID=1872138 RepID=UPI002D7EAB57|nr:TIGR00266 family protein [Actinophytocola sp.]HET9141050.1 TIGR00266 family protein [Actinophytocola sp.]